MSARPAGFTLIELAVVLFVTAAVLGAALTPLATQREARARRQTAADMEHAIEALYGYAILHGRLPCPDVATSGDGREDRAGTDACVAAEGDLPYVDLAVRGIDAWGRRLRYRVTTRVAGNASGAGFTAVDDGRCAAADGDLDLCTRGLLEIRSRGDDPASTALEAKHDRRLADGVPALIVSLGADPGIRGGDERENQDGDTSFRARVYAVMQPGCRDDGGESTPLCAFDDLVRWLSPTVLGNRLVSAGRLP